MKNYFSLLLIVLLTACNSSETTQDYKSKDYVVYMRGNEAGLQTSTLENGTYKFTFQYNDRGRGPEIEQSISLNKQGSVASMEITGVNYLKDTISEVFKIENGKAFWESSSEKGTGDQIGRTAGKMAFLFP